MSDLVKAIFEHGAFVPETPCDLPEGTRVLLAIQQERSAQPPEVKAPEERARILQQPRFSRDYSTERHQWLGEQTLESLVDEIRQNRNPEPSS